ncbi:adhesion G protein-coupled receptor E5 [Stigmatopora argus]
MLDWRNLLLVGLFLSLGPVSSASECERGKSLNDDGNCSDFNECEQPGDNPAGDVQENVGICGTFAKCINTNGSFYCICDQGFQTLSKSANFTPGEFPSCQDINECIEKKTICRPDCVEESFCGPNAACVNMPGSYRCTCNAGYAIKSGAINFNLTEGPCEAGCWTDIPNYCGNGTCQTGVSGPYCQCHAGFTNYGHKAGRCTALDCDAFKDTDDLEKNFPIASDLMTQLRRICVNMPSGNAPENVDDREPLLKFLRIIDHILAAGVLNDNRKVSIFLDMVESALKLIGPLIRDPPMRRVSVYSELDLFSYKTPTSPQGLQVLRTNAVKLEIHSETVAGDPSQYPGFASVALLSYANLETFTHDFDSAMDPEANRSFLVNSKVATVSVSNPNTTFLEEPVVLRFDHLIQVNDSHHTCVFWDTSHGDGSWSPHGCSAVTSDSESTVCSCDHLSTFAVLMALYDVEASFELRLMTTLGLSLSLVCLLVCILTFWLVRSIQSTRTSIHLHLCICLFAAAFIFLVGISRTENQGVCATVAGLLHFFFLAAFCWMCLEGVQLFRMVILVFNSDFPTSYMMAGGYGVPAVMVAVSVLVNSKGYGTPKYCWLDVKLIWNFLGPACIIIAINIFFFVITVWKLAQKFSSLNPDLNTLQKIKTFTVTAAAQLCVLGTTWIFGCFQFDESTVVLSYIFTFFASLQGVMLFVMHCLFSKQVRDEYRNFLCRFNAPPKKNSFDVNLSTGKQNASRSSQDTGELHI